jgi:hypothetical protein
MIIADIERYLAARKRAPLADIACRLETDTEALRPMLTLLERKGRVRRVTPATCASGCGKCRPEDLEIYEAVEP